MTNNYTKIMISGEGGQGVQTIAKILFEVLSEKFEYATYIPSFGPEQRGTPSIAFVQSSDKNLNYPRFDKADYLIILRERAISKVEEYCDKNTTIIFDSSAVRAHLLPKAHKKIYGIPAMKLANTELTPQVLNVVILGVIANLIFKFEKNDIWKHIKLNLGKKFIQKPKLEEINKTALNLAYSINFEDKIFSDPKYRSSDEIIIHSNNEKTAVIIPKYCKGCGICIYKCPVKALKFGEVLGIYGTPVPEIDLEKCIACGNCFRFCPDSAIKVEKN